MTFPSMKESLPADALLRVNEVCDHFEAAWKGGERPRIEDFLGATPAPERTHLLRELLILEWHYAQSRGIPLSCEDYEQRFPQHRELIREAVAMTVSMRPCRPSNSDASRAADLIQETLTDATAPRTASSVHRRIGRFQLESALGQGGFGRVYRAYDPVLDREVAIKVPKFSTADQQQVDRFLQEAKAVARLRHPNIVMVFEIGQSGDEVYITSEFVDGMPLSTRLKENPPSFRQAAQWVRDLALALAYAHEEGIIHRDVKPANIMIDRHGRAQIMDFGLAKRLSVENARSSEESISEGNIVGTPAYMAPEQARGETRAVGPHSDQHSLGVVLYELLTGKRPYEGKPEAVLKQAANPKSVFLAPRQHNRKIPLDLQTICLKAMAKDAARRYAGASDLAVDLQLWLKEKPIQAPFPLGERFEHWCRHHPRAAIGTALATIALIVVGGLFLRYRAQLADAIQREQQQTRTAIDEFRRLQCHLYREKALRLCEQNPGQGVLILARALEIATNLGEEALAHRLRNEIAHGTRRLISLEACVPLAGGDGRPVTASAVSPDRRMLLTGHRDGNAQLWDIASGQAIGEPIRHSDVVWAAVFSADGKKIVTGCADRTARQWDTASGKPISKPFLHRSAVRSVAISPDGATVFTGASDGSGEFWDAATGQPRGVSVPHRTGVLGAAFSPDGKTIVTGAEDGTAQIWNVASGEALGLPLRHEHAVCCVAFSPDGTMILTGTADRKGATSGAESAQLWDRATGQPLGQPLPHKTKISCVGFGKDSNTAWTVDAGNLSKDWDVSALQPIGVAVEPEGELTVTVGLPENRSVKLPLRGRVPRRTWDLAAINALGLPIDAGREHNREHNADARADWDFTSLLGLPLRHHGKVQDEAFHKDGTVFATASGKTIYLWDTATGRPHDIPQIVHEHKVDRVAFRADIVMAYCGGKGYYSWELKTGKPSREIITVRPTEFNRQQALVHHFSSRASNAQTFYAPGRAYYMIVEGKKAQLWNAATDSPVGSVLEHTEKNEIEFATFSADGALLLTCGRREARIWETSTGKPLGWPLRPVSRAIFSPDRKKILGVDGQEVRLWSTPVSATEQAGIITLWVQVLTGMELAADAFPFPESGGGHAMATSEPKTPNLFLVLDAATWEARRQRFEQMLGLPSLQLLSGKP